MNEKKCSKCGVSKPLTEYHKCKRIKCGVVARCKACVRENEGSRAAYFKQYYKANKEDRKAYQKEYYKAVKDTPEHKAMKANYQKKRRKEDPAFKLRHNVSKAVNKALKRSNGSKAGQSTFKHLPYTVKALKEHIESQFDEHMSWDNHGSYWEIDHIYPHSKLHYDSLEHPNFKKVWALSNLRPLEKTANRMKSDKII